MHFRLLAVGDRQPAWVDTAFARYAERLPRQWHFKLESLATAKRSKNDRSHKARDAEGERLLAKISKDDQVVLLDERGRTLSSVELAGQLGHWQAAGRNLVFVIGGPDGVSAEVRQRADFCCSLSALTLPHGLARVLLIEQLYRAWSLQNSHPYHRA